MQILNPFSKILTFFTATLMVLNSYTPNAKADSTEVLELNGIALNLNSIYGYKYGHMNVSQYLKSNGYDAEQQWNLRDLNDGTFLAESVSKPGECVNAHNPQVGSTVNIMPCDRNDPEQKLKKENGSIVLAKYNLRLNLGDANDTVVKLTPMFSKNNYFERKTNGFLPSHQNGTKPATCLRYIDDVVWIYRDIYNGKYDWSLEIKPSACGLLTRNTTPWAEWQEVVEKTPNLKPSCSDFSREICSKLIWDKKYNTSQYWSMYNQYICHSEYAGYLYKNIYHIEPATPDVGIQKFIITGCNPQL
jgi:Protein of unknown function (DUF2599)